MTIRYKLFIVVGLIIVAVSVAFTAINYAAQKHALLKGIDEKLFVATRLAATAVPADYHDRIVDRNSVSPDEFARIVDRNNRLCLELNLQYLWSCQLVNNQIVFTTATSPSKDVRKGDHAAFFDVHMDPQAFIKVFRTMQPDYSSFHNQWGHGRKVLIPGTDRNGRPFCFGASVSVSDVDTMLRQTLMKSLILCMGILLVGLCVSGVVSSSLSKPIRELTSMAKVVSDQQDYSVRARKYSMGELGFLTDAFNDMLTQIQQRTTELCLANEHLQRDITERKRVEERERIRNLFHPASGRGRQTPAARCRPQFARLL